MNLQHFSEETTESTEQVETPKVNEPTVEEPENKPDEAQAKTFTQAEIDDIIAKRIERERKKYEGYDDLKQKAEKYEKESEERRLAELSEKERAEELAKKFEEEKSELAKQLDEFKSQVEREKVTNEFIKQAQAANIAYIDDAIALSDLSAVTVEDGKIVGVEDAIKSLIENKPFLLAQAKKEPKTVGGPSNQSDNKSQKTAEQLLKDAAEKSRLSGKPEDKIAYAKLKRELS
jgi:hypothetical protein